MLQNSKTFHEIKKKNPKVQILSIEWRIQISVKGLFCSRQSSLC